MDQVHISHEFSGTVKETDVFTLRDQDHLVCKLETDCRSASSFKNALITNV